MSAIAGHAYCGGRHNDYHKGVKMPERDSAPATCDFARRADARGRIGGMNRWNVRGMEALRSPKEPSSVRRHKEASGEEPRRRYEEHPEVRGDASY